MTVDIRKFNADDITNKVRWINDIDNNKFLHYNLPLEEEKTKIWYEKSKNDSHRYDAIIEYNGIAIGIIGLLGIQNGCAEYYITLGEKAYKGKGIAREATFQILEYAFYILKLNTVYLYTETANFPAHHLFKACGFQKKNLEIASAINNGTIDDRFYYEISKEDYLIYPKSLHK